MNTKKPLLNRLYCWLFDEDERAPIGFIPALFMCILISIGINLLLIPVIAQLMKG